MESNKNLSEHTFSDGSKKELEIKRTEKRKNNQPQLDKEIFDKLTEELL